VATRIHWRCGPGLVVNLAHRHFELAGLALQQLAADFDGAAALVLIEPVLDLVAGAGALDEGEPIALGLWSFCVTTSTMSPVRSLVRSGTMRPLTLAPTQVWPTSV